MSHKSDPHYLYCHQADHLRDQDRDRKTDQKRQSGAAGIFEKKHQKKFGLLHAHHDIDTKFMGPPLDLVLTGKVDQGENDKERKAVKDGDHGEQFSDRITFQCFQVAHHVLAVQRKHHIKSDDRDDQRPHEKRILFMTSDAVTEDELKEHLRILLPAVPALSGYGRKKTRGSPHLLF